MIPMNAARTIAISDVMTVPKIIGNAPNLLVIGSQELFQMNDGPKATIDGHDRHELDEEADDQQGKQNAPAVDDRSEATVGRADEPRDAPKLRPDRQGLPLHLPRSPLPHLARYEAAERSQPTCILLSLRTD